MAADVLAYFTPEDLARGAQHARVEWICGGLDLAVDLALLLAFAFSGPARRLLAVCRERTRALDTPLLVRALGHGWAGCALFLAILASTRQLSAFPTSLYRDFLHSHALGLSHETLSAFLGDRVRDLVFSAFGFALLGAVLPAVRDRWPSRWWLVVGLAGALGLVVDTAADPLRVRLDYTMTPLADGPLRARLEALAQRERLEIGEIVVVDTSKDASTANAFVMGVGPTSKLVLTDTLVAWGDEAAAGAAAHEIGHRRSERLPRRLAFASLGLVAFLLLVEATVRFSRRMKVDSTVQALPLVVVAVTVVGLVVLPFRAASGRAEELEADALELSVRHDYDAYIDEQVKLVRANALEPEPSPFEQLLADHPSAADRIRAALARRSTRAAEPAAGESL